MKILKPLLSLAVIFLFSCDGQGGEDLTYYGSEMSSDEVLKPVSFLNMMEDKDSATVKITGTIIETCSKKGCWMTVDLGQGDEMRVTFKDYGFFVPTDGVQGKKVYFEGLAKKEVTDVKTLRHYAKDAGKSEEEIAMITGPRSELNFIASSVAIKNVDQAQE